MSARYEALLEHARDIILFVGERGKIVEANRAALLAYGYSREEMLGLGIRDLRAEDTHPEVAAQMRRAARDGLLFETVHRRKDGSVFPVEVSSKSAELGEPLLISVIRDITERKRAEDELRRARDELEQRVFERTRELDEANEALRAEMASLERAWATIELQAAELMDRSVLVLSLREGLLFAPIVGPLDGARVLVFSTKLLEAVVERRARVVLIDVTGVTTLDAGAVRALLGLISSVKLVGADVLITGVRALAAKELVESGVELQGLSTHATLERGLSVALGRLGR